MIHVPADHPTIQQAIDVAANGDTVLVSPGTYFETINFKGKKITVTSSDGPLVTFIDGGGMAPVVRFVTGEDRNSRLSGFTVQHGLPIPSQSVDGGGIGISSASPTITNNVIKNNQACVGAGIAIRSGSPLVQGNTIKDNTFAICGGVAGVGGGGISLVAADSGEIVDNIISNNSAVTSDGGGISLFSAGTPMIRNNVIKENSASRGGGIWMANFSDPLIVQNLIVGNNAQQGGGIWWSVPLGQRLLVNNTIAENTASFDTSSGIFAEGFDSQIRLVNNIIVAKAGQTAVFCSNFADPNPPIFDFNDVFSAGGVAFGGTCTDKTGIAGNISVDPKFLNPAAGNFRPAASSLTIDAGDNTAPNLPSTDLDGIARTVDSNQDGTAIVDMGVFESIADFQLGMPTPSSITMLNGAVSQPIAFEVSAISSFTGSVNLSCTGLPTNAVCVFSPTAAPTPTEGQPITVTLQIVTLTSTPLGPASVTIEAQGTGIAAKKTRNLSLNVTGGTATTDLAMIASHAPDPVGVGAKVTLVFEITNTGTAAANVELFAAFSNAIFGVLATASQGSCSGTGQITCNLGAMNDGAVATVQLEVKTGMVRSLRADALVSSGASDSSPNNNTDSATVPIRLRPWARQGLPAKLP